MEIKIVNISMFLLAIGVGLSSCAQKPVNAYTIFTNIDTFKIPAVERGKSNAAVIFYEDKTDINSQKTKRLTKDDYTIPKQVEVFWNSDTLSIFIGKNCCDSGYITIRAYNGLFFYSYYSPREDFSGFHPTGPKGKLILSEKPTCLNGEKIAGEFEGFFFYTVSSTDNVIRTIKMNIIFKGTLSMFEPPGGN